MQVNTVDDDRPGLTRRRLLGLTTLTSARLTAASVFPKPEPLQSQKNSSNKAYASTLKSPYPARDFIGVKDLLFGAHFEVMGIAVRNASQNKRQPLAVK